MEPLRRYSDKEVGAILRRAAELQSVDAEGPRGPSDLDLGIEDLERIGGEVGIDARHVRAAASELDSGDLAQKRFHWGGAPDVVNMERVVEGEISTEAWEDAVAYLRRTCGDAGQSGQTGSSMEWKSSAGDLCSLTVSATPRKGRTRITVMRDYSGAMGLTLVVGTAISFLCSIGLATFVSKAGGGVAGAVLTVIGFILLCVTLLRSVLGRLARRDGKKLNVMMDTLAGLVTSGGEVVQPAIAEETSDMQLRLQ